MFTIGHDVEIFVADSGGKIVPSIGLFGGTKEKGVPISPDYPEFCMLEDNVTLEFNVPASATSWDWDTNQQLLKSLSKRMLRSKELLATAKASHSFPEESLSDPESWIFGCEPDFNAWTGEMNSKPSSSDPFLRSCGGHIHIGLDIKGNKEKMGLVKYLDYYVGLAMTCRDPDNLRRTLYGKAGAMRFKPYGVEYRTPSNFWYVTNQDMFIYNLVHRAVEAWATKRSLPYFKDIPRAINGEDKDLLTYIAHKATELTGVQYVP